MMERKAVGFDFKGMGEDGRFGGYASLFGVKDLGGDVVRAGAFTKSLQSGMKPKMLWQHDPSQPIGVWDDVREDAKGLYVEGRILSDVKQGAEALSLIRAGAIDGMSIGYRTKEATRENGARSLNEVELHEVSIVTFPMLPSARGSAKSIETERDFERFLRDAGYSRKEATALALHGFKGLTGLRDAGSDDGQDEGLAAFMAQIRRMQEKLNV
jgi:HK97 family phage prohead protease